MRNNNTNEICDYCNADWAKNFDRKISTTDFCIIIDENLVIWKNKK
jgi:hypothetical protein